MNVLQHIVIGVVYSLIAKLIIHFVAKAYDKKELGK